MKVNFHLDKKNKPQSENGMKVVYGQAKRGGYRLRWFLILAIVMSPLLFMAYYLFKKQVLVTAPGIVTSYPLTITATQAATVGSVSVNVGDEVDKAQLLILLADRMLNKEVEFIQKELVSLSNNKINNTDELYQQAIANTKTSLAKVQQIQQKYDQFREKGQVSEVDYAAVVNVSNAIESQLSSQEIAYINAKSDREQLALAGPVLQQYRALMQELVVKLAQHEMLTFSAPFSGRVLDIHIHEGQRVTENAPLLTMAQNVTPDIIAYLSPKYLDYSSKETQAKVVFPDGKTFSAAVSKPVEIVNKLPQELQSPFESQSAYLKVTLSFGEPMEKIRWVEGVEVEVRF
ncbi:HlyD family secretion protein [Vibrio jasicida]|uniref:HlyD family secretion protein n=1 Tax=Vibrio jasicida TaxID=766224 RepID=UPI000399A2FC|nr:hemolysin D [Vibrio jasicida]